MSLFGAVFFLFNEIFVNLYLRLAGTGGMLLTKLSIGEIPETYSRFSDFIVESHWKNSVSQIKQQVRGNSFLRDFLLQEKALAFQFEHLIKSDNSRKFLFINVVTQF